MSDHVPALARIKVTLTADERERVTLQAAADAKQFAGRNVFEPGRGDQQPKRILEGKGAQAALAKWLTGSVPHNCAPPRGVFAYYTPISSGGVILRRDAPTGRWVLVVGRLPGFELVGWAHADAVRMRGEWWEKRKPGGWFMPQSELQPMSTFESATS